MTAVAADVLADGLVVFGVLFRGRRHDVIEHDDVQVRAGNAELREIGGYLLHDGRGVVVREEMVGPDRDDLARPDLIASRLAGQNFFCERFSHGNNLVGWADFVGWAEQLAPPYDSLGV